MNRLHRFFVCPLRMKLLLAESFARLALISLLVRIVPSSVITRRLVAEPYDISALAPEDLPAKYSNEEICWAVLAAAKYVPGATCLAQSLVGRSMLRREGYPAEIRIGVANEAREFGAHAWVWSGNRIVLGESTSVFAEFPRKARDH
jgi:hypothetical protein